MEVVQGSEATSATVDKIARAANLQATSIAEVAQGIDQISSVVQTNSDTAEESAAASEELSGQAQILSNLILKFKLTDTSSLRDQDTVGSFEPQSRPALGGKY